LYRVVGIITNIKCICFMSLRIVKKTSLVFKVLIGKF